MLHLTRQNKIYTTTPTWQIPGKYKWATGNIWKNGLCWSLQREGEYMFAEVV